MNKRAAEICKAAIFVAAIFGDNALRLQSGVVKSFFQHLEELCQGGPRGPQNRPVFPFSFSSPASRS